MQAGLLLVLDLECALDKNLVERKGQAVDRQHSRRARSTLMHYERETHICSCSETRDIGNPGKRRSVLVYASTRHLAGHVHCIHRERNVRGR